MHDEARRGWASRSVPSVVGEAKRMTDLSNLSSSNPCLEMRIGQANRRKEWLKLPLAIVLNELEIVVSKSGKSSSSERRY